MTKIPLHTFSVSCGFAAALTALTALSLLAACSPDTDRIFDASPAVRQQQAAADYAALLETPAQGWAMDFYPGSFEFGGIAYTARFHDGKVTLATEQAIDNSAVEGRPKGRHAAAEEVTSDYRIVNGQGVVLTFDTYNALMHYWSQPAGTDFDGYASDYEFTFVSATADEVVLRGVRHGNLLRLYPLSMSSADYLAAVTAMRRQLSTGTRKRAVADGTVMPVTALENHLQYGAGESTVDVAYTYTDRGLRFHQPVSAGALSVLELLYNAETDDLTSPDGRFVLPHPTPLEHFCGASRQWRFVIGKTDATYDMCDTLRTITKAASAQLGRLRYESLRECYIGLNKLSREEDSQRFVMGWTTAYSSWTYEVCHGIDLYVEDEQAALVSITARESGNLYYNYAAIFSPMLDFVTAHSPYTVSFEGDAESPTSVRLTSREDPSVWFTLK